MFFDVYCPFLMVVSRFLSISRLSSAAESKIQSGIWVKWLGIVWKVVEGHRINNQS
jgi:hypothetical protein